MAVYETEDRVRQKRTKTEQAVTLATKGRWEEAARLNREVLELYPDDVDALNRLGKALMELGQYADARAAYAQAARLDPMNSIAHKNLQRLAKLVEEAPAAAGAATAVDPRLFIEESGKTTTTQLTNLRRRDAATALTAGDELKLKVAAGNRALVVSQAGEEIARIEPRLEQDLVRLLEMGNQYAVVVTAATDQAITIIIRETSRSAAMGNRPSFRPSAAPEGGQRAYTRVGLLRDEAEDEDEEDLLEEEEEEVERDPVVAEADAVTEEPLEALAAEEDAEEPT